LTRLLPVYDPRYAETWPPRPSAPRVVPATDDRAARGSAPTRYGSSSNALGSQGSLELGGAAAAKGDATDDDLRDAERRILAGEPLEDTGPGTPRAA
jgi:hypothetical protein